MAKTIFGVDLGAQELYRRVQESLAKRRDEDEDE